MSILKHLKKKVTCTKCQKENFMKNSLWKVKTPPDNYCPGGFLFRFQQHSRRFQARAGALVGRFVRALQRVQVDAVRQGR